MGAFDGQTVLVTGAARGIGLAMAQAFAREEARLVLVDRDRDALENAVAALPGAVALEADLERAEEADGLVARAVEAAGPPDVVVNNAGLFLARPSARMSVDDWDRLLAVNLRAPFLIGRGAGACMAGRGRGCIINVSSVAAWYPRTDQAAYCASKAAVEHLTRVFALELAAAGVRVNALRPGVVDTPLLRESFGDNGAARWTAAIPLGRPASVEDMAEAALYLALARHVTGHVLCVDGGQTLNFVSLQGDRNPNP